MRFRFLIPAFLAVVVSSCQESSRSGGSGVRGDAVPARGDTLALPASRGTVEVLNGTPLRGVGARVAQILRDRGFDVVKVGNAPDRNHEVTLVAQRHEGSTVPEAVAGALGLKRTLPYHNENLLVDATVYIGQDIQEILPP